MQVGSSSALGSRCEWKHAPWTHLTGLGNVSQPHRFLSFLVSSLAIFLGFVIPPDQLRYFCPSSRLTVGVLKPRKSERV